MQTFHCRKIWVLWMWYCGVGWLCLTVILLELLDHWRWPCCSHLKCQQLLAQWHSITSQKTCIFGNTAVRTSNLTFQSLSKFWKLFCKLLQHSTAAKFITILLHCTIHNHYLISLRIWNSQIQLGLILRRGSFYDRLTFTTLFESDGALPTCGASMSQLKRPFST
jgi:hypothetical protein